MMYVYIFHYLCYVFDRWKRLTNYYIFRTLWNMTADERLDLLVEFCNRNIDEMKPGDWLNASYDIKRFVARPESADELGWAFPILTPKEDDPELSEDEIRHLWSGARALFAGYVDTRETLKKGLPAEPGQMVLIHGEVKLLPVRPDQGSAVALWAGSQLQDDFYMIIVSLVTSRDTAQVRTCPVEECDRLFVRRGRQLYCTSEHARLTGVRAFRDRNKKK